MIKANVGEVDSNIRLFAGVVLMVLAFLTGGIFQYLFMFAGFILVITSIIRFCPAYILLGKNTCEIEKK